MRRCGSTAEWVQYGGLLEPVELITTGPASIGHLSLRAAPVAAVSGSDAQVTAVVEVRNTGGEPFAGRVRMEADGHAIEGTATLPPRATGRVALEIRLPRARLWDPASPHLYDAQVTLLDASGEIDSIDDRFGVRTIEAQGRRILLNGKPLAVRGVNRYDEFPGGGPVVDEATIRADLEAVKATGANLIRTHYPQSPVNLRLADEMGLLVMEEAPLDWWRASWHPPVPPELDDDRIVDVAEEALDRMVRRDGNHPALVIWSMANECRTDDERGIRAMERLLRRARALDPSRLVTYVANRGFEKNRAFALADLVAVNLYYGMWDGPVAARLAEIPDRVQAPTRRALFDRRPKKARAAMRALWAGQPARPVQ